MKRPSRLVVASGNPGKVAEIRALLRGLELEVRAAPELGWTGEILEDGDTLEANAAKKAREVARALNEVTVADDSGLFVDALGGRPGVHSARYAGESQDSRANCAKLLVALADLPPERRGAEFRCIIALATPEGEEHLFSGRCRGRIGLEPRGTGGFGYDPLFEVGSQNQTFAEMPAEEKHTISHRGMALSKLRSFVTALADEECS